MDTAWYAQSYIMSGGDFFKRCGTLINSTIEAAFDYGYTDFFEIIYLLILFGVVAGLLLYMFRNTKK